MSIRYGRSVLGRLNKNAATLSKEDRDLLEFFNDCLSYKEILYALISNERTDTEHLEQWQVTPDMPISIVPHPWTGVSPDLLRPVGKAMLICRQSQQQAKGFQHVVSEDGLDICEAAAEIENVLYSVELPESWVSDNTSEQFRHLNAIADACRRSALLQLYQTFPRDVSESKPIRAASYLIVSCYHLLLFISRTSFVTYQPSLRYVTFSPCSVSAQRRA
jgi:hypothetical protein